MGEGWPIPWVMAFLSEGGVLGEENAPPSLLTYLVQGVLAQAR